MLREFIALLCRGQARRGCWEAAWLATVPVLAYITDAARIRSTACRALAELDLRPQIATVAVPNLREHGIRRVAREGS